MLGSTFHGSAVNSHSCAALASARRWGLGSEHSCQHSPHGADLPGRLVLPPSPVNIQMLGPVPGVSLHVLISSLLQPWEIGGRCRYSARFAGENLKQREVKSFVQGHTAGQLQGQSGSNPQGIMASWELQDPAAETMTSLSPEGTSHGLCPSL